MPSVPFCFVGGSGGNIANCSISYYFVIRQIPLVRDTASSVANTRVGGNCVPALN